MLGFEALSESPLATLPGAASSAVNYTLSCAAGSYTYTGKDATLTVQRNYTLSCAAGSYTYTGVAATLTYTPGSAKVDYTLACDSGTYSYTGNAATLTYSGAAATTQPSGGISHGGKRKKPQIAVITVDGQDYRVPIDQVQAFLDRMREQVVKPEKAIAKVEKKKAKAPKKAYEPPVIVVKSAPPDVMQMISARVDRSNEIIRKMWEGTILRRIREMEIDDEEAIILLLAA